MFLGKHNTGFHLQTALKGSDYKRQQENVISSIDCGTLQEKRNDS